ncbi:hypothetical protein CHS0354_009089 [Potamilus streckersoni]|uniref:Uncharacterized protein n=1 Tax=Potamilus streckersoni TaxID=2493646 RepID=A0AAE0THR2_9BIVA|nr:hypothetical protein CHS0354_009089 [Potamilus streckersoni]
MHYLYKRTWIGNNAHKLLSSETVKMKLSCILLLVFVVCVPLAARKPKKPGKPSSKDDFQDEIEDLQEQVRELQAQVATITAKATGPPDDSNVQVGNIHIHLHGKDDHMMSTADDPNDKHIHLHMHVDGCPGHDHDDDHHQHRHKHWPKGHNNSSGGNSSLDKYVFENDHDEIHAHCDFIPNIDLPEAERENPHGYVHFSQKVSALFSMCLYVCVIWTFKVALTIFQYYRYDSSMLEFIVMFSNGTSCCRYVA